MVLFVCSLVLLACKTKQDNAGTATEQTVANVNGSQLLFSDVAAILPNEMTSQDSAAFAKNYIKKWASNEVFYQQALNYLSDEELNVDKELEAYKKELIAYKFQTKLVNEKLDTTVTNEQIEKFYNNNNSLFLLKNNIVKVLYVKTPTNIPNFEKLKSLCYSSNNAKDAEQLQSLCVQYANNFYMNDNTWLLFEDLKKEIPQLKEIPEYSLQRGKTFEFIDNNSFYFLKIIDIKSKNTLSPINFEKPNIKNMLINQRKQQLIYNIKKDFFDKALTNKEIEIQ